MHDEAGVRWVTVLEVPVLRTAAIAEATDALVGQIESLQPRCTLKVFAFHLDLQRLSGDLRPAALAVVRQKGYDDVVAWLPLPEGWIVDEDAAEGAALDLAGVALTTQIDPLCADGFHEVLDCGFDGVYGIVGRGWRRQRGWRRSHGGVAVEFEKMRAIDFKGMGGMRG